MTATKAAWAAAGLGLLILFAGWRATTRPPPAADGGRKPSRHDPVPEPVAAGDPLPLPEEKSFGKFWSSLEGIRSRSDLPAAVAQREILDRTAEFLEMPAERRAAFAADALDAASEADLLRREMRRNSEPLRLDRSDPARYHAEWRSTNRDCLERLEAVRTRIRTHLDPARPSHRRFLDLLDPWLSLLLPKS